MGVGAVTPTFLNRIRQFLTLGVVSESRHSACRLSLSGNVRPHPMWTANYAVQVILQVAGTSLRLLLSITTMAQPLAMTSAMPAIDRGSGKWPKTTAPETTAQSVKQ